MERVDVSTVSRVCVCLTRLRSFSESCLLSLRAISVCAVVVVTVFACGCVHIMIYNMGEKMRPYHKLALVSCQLN